MELLEIERAATRRKIETVREYARELEENLATLHRKLAELERIDDL